MILEVGGNNVEGVGDGIPMPVEAIEAVAETPDAVEAIAMGVSNGVGEVLESGGEVRLTNAKNRIEDRLNKINNFIASIARPSFLEELAKKISSFATNDNKYDPTNGPVLWQLKDDAYEILLYLKERCGYSSKETRIMTAVWRGLSQAWLIAKHAKIFPPMQQWEAVERLPDSLKLIHPEVPMDADTALESEIKAVAALFNNTGAQQTNTQLN